VEWTPTPHPAGGKRRAAAEKPAPGTDDFLRKRYAMQSIRLQFYAEKYQDAIAYYEAHKEAMKGDDSASYRFLDLAAGAFAHEKQRARANYLYSRVFAGFPPLRKSAKISFRPQNEGDWAETLKLAATPREKAELWRMVGLYNDPARAVTEIYALDPMSDLLPLLVVRTVNDAELEFVPADSTPGTAADKAIAALKGPADTGKAPKLGVWYLGIGHLYAMKGDAKNAEAYLQKAEAAPLDNAAFKEQLALSRIVTRVRSLKAIPSERASLTSDLVWLDKKGAGSSQYDVKSEPKDLDDNRAAHFYDFAKPFLAGLLKSGGDQIRALLLVPNRSDAFYADNGNIDKMQQVLANAKSSAFDSFLAGLAPPTANELKEAKGLNLLYAGDLEGAAVQLAGAKTAQLPGDPFLSHIEDCHDCDHAAKQAKKYTKAEFVARMVELSKTKTAQAAYDLGTGYYNMSYFGNARALYTDTLGGTFDLEKRRMQTGNAQKAYEEAIALSKDREFQARAHFMAAKAERDAFYASRLPSDAYHVDSDQLVYGGKHFTALATSFADTAYYKEALKECGYFDYWVKHRN
jgi:hypothetical protein